MNITEGLQKVKSLLPSDVTLVAVSKTKPHESILEAYNSGQRVFGENKVQELCEKFEALPKDISWHMIGHLQRNKVKYIAPFVDLIHGVDSLRLLKEINKQGEKIKRVIPILLQFHIAQEESKFGFSLEEIREITSDQDFTSFKYIDVQGVMGMATNSDDQSLVRKEFANLFSIHDVLSKEIFSYTSSFKTISMGMSGDYQLAIEEGSNMVRVGSSIFGSRY